LIEKETDEKFPYKITKQQKIKGEAPIKGKRKSKKDKLREQGSL